MLFATLHMYIYTCIGAAADLMGGMDSGLVTATYYIFHALMDASHALIDASSTRLLPKLGKSINTPSVSSKVCHAWFCTP